MIKTITNLLQKYREAISYLFFGGLTTLIYLVTFFGMSLFSPHAYLINTVIAWFVSVLFAFFTNKWWVFQSKTTTFGQTMWEMARFFFFRIASLIPDMLITWVGISVLHASPFWVKIIDQIIIVLLNYIFSKWLVFRRPPIERN